MNTHNGGWTLVYSYTFTNYNSFTSQSNALTPRPNWPPNNTNVLISTTPPLNESSLGVVDWNQWKEIGHEFMVKSNINDWIVCKPDGGSIVAEKNGSIICQNIKNMATTCSGVVPYKVGWYSCGPGLYTNSLASFFYLYDGNADNWCWPEHNPCGVHVWKNNTSTHQKKGVSNPGGQIFVR